VSGSSTADRFLDELRRWYGGTIPCREFDAEDCPDRECGRPASFGIGDLDLLGITSPTVCESHVRYYARDRRFRLDDFSDPRVGPSLLRMAFRLARGSGTAA